MLPHYGVLIGDFVSSSVHQGQWLHAVLHLNVAGVPYQGAVDVNQPTLGFQYRILNNLPASLFAAVTPLPDGYHELARNSTSGAIDYARSPLPPGAWTTVTGMEAKDALVKMVTSSKKLYVFGAPFSTGHGMHDIHYNQGDPWGSQWYASNGIWQDGCVVAQNNDGSYSMYLGRFLNEAPNTDSNGNPVTATSSTAPQSCAPDGTSV